MSESKTFRTLEEQIENVHSQLSFGDFHTEEGSRLVQNFEVLYSLQLKEQAAQLDRSKLNLDFDRLEIEKERLNLDRLELKVRELEIEAARKLNPNTILSSVVSLAGILMILGYEQTHVLTSKALGFIPRTRS